MTHSATTSWQATILRIKPPRIAWALLATALAAHFILRAGGGAHPLPLAGSAAILVGFGIMIWSWALFRSRRVPICPTQEGRNLVTNGPFRISRNPMYLGITLMLAGAALCLGSWPMWLAPVGFFLIMQKIFIPFEEGTLTRNFGDDYARYRRAVSRWIGAPLAALNVDPRHGNGGTRQA